MGWGWAGLDLEKDFFLIWRLEGHGSDDDCVLCNRVATLGLGGGANDNTDRRMEKHRHKERGRGRGRGRSTGTSTGTGTGIGTKSEALSRAQGPVQDGPVGPHTTRYCLLTGRRV
jgi:hypothetical protein